MSKHFILNERLKRETSVELNLKEFKMGRKDTLAAPIAIGQSLAASFVTPATIVQYGDNYSYQINVTIPHEQ